MASVIRNVRDIDPRERQLLEHVLGQPLRENQQLIIQVVTLDQERAAPPEPPQAAPSPRLPDWCNVFAGLDDEQIAAVEEIVRPRADLTRSFP